MPTITDLRARRDALSKAGQSDIRRLLIIGAMTRIMGRARHRVPAESWIGRMLARKPKMLVGIALANNPLTHSANVLPGNGWPAKSGRC